MENNWLKRPSTLRWLWMGFLMVLTATLVADLLVERHPNFAVADWFGFNAVFGFIACAAMILIAKAIGVVLKRTDHYYDDC